MALDNLISKDFYLVPTCLHTLHSPGRTPTTVPWEAEDETVALSQRGPQLKANIMHEQWDSRWVGPGSLSVLGPGGWLAQILHSQRVSNMVSHYCLHMRQYVLFWWIRCIIGLILPQFLKLYFDILKLICIYIYREREKEWSKETQEWNIQEQRNRAISPGFGAHIDSWGRVLHT